MNFKKIICALVSYSSLILASTHHQNEEVSKHFSTREAPIVKSFTHDETQSEQQRTEIEDLLNKYTILPTEDAASKYNDRKRLVDNLLNVNNPEFILVEALNIEPNLGKKDATAYLVTYIDELLKTGNFKKHQDISFFIKSITNNISNVNRAEFYEQLVVQGREFPLDSEILFLMNTILLKYNTDSMNRDLFYIIEYILNCKPEFLKWVLHFMPILPGEVNYAKYQRVFEKIPADRMNEIFEISNKLLDESILKPGSYYLFLQLFETKSTDIIKNAMEEIRTEKPTLVSMDFVDAIKKKTQTPTT